MSHEHLPPCAFCGAKKYESQGGTHSSTCSIQRLRCRCARDVVVLTYSARPRWPAFYVFWLADGAQDTFTQWLHSVMMPALRSWESQCRDAYTSARIAIIEKLRAKHDFWTDGRGSVRWHELPQSVSIKLDDWETDYIRPAELLDSPLTPKLPTCVHGVRKIYYPEPEKWMSIIHDEVADLEVPADPFVVRNAQFWKGVFAEVGIEHFVDTENRYMRSGVPWFAFIHGHATYLVGWRKHVIALQAIYAEPVDATSLGALARADSVTFKICPDLGCAGGQEIEIHAWSREKCVEYLKVMLALEKINPKERT